MKIHLRNGLPHISAVLFHGGLRLMLEHVLLDTGSAGTIFPTDRLLDVGVEYEANDVVHRIRGVGGSEFVFGKRIDRLVVDRLRADGFEVEVGAMNYGFEVDGILGTDFLMQTGAVIDMEQLELRAATGSAGLR